LPLQAVGAEFRRAVPAQPVARVAGFTESAHESAAIFLVSPVVTVAVKRKVLETTSEKMFGGEPRARRVVHQNSGEFQMGPAKTEIHGWPPCLHYKLGKVIPRAQPGENAVAFPTPGYQAL